MDVSSLKVAGKLHWSIESLQHSLGKRSDMTLVGHALVELKDELNKRGLSTAGLKQEVRRQLSMSRYSIAGGTDIS
jgi:hypothetical protein